MEMTTDGVRAGLASLVEFNPTGVEPSFQCNLAGYAAQAAAKELIENWDEALQNDLSGKIVGNLIGDVDDTITALKAFRERALAILPERLCGEAKASVLKHQVNSALERSSLVSATAGTTANVPWTNEMGPMSEGQYVALKGVRCPSCGGSDVSGRQLTVDGGAAFQPMACSECEASWSDSYALTGYSDLEGGINLEAVESTVDDVRNRGQKHGFSVDSEAQAREFIRESCDILGIDLSEMEVKIALSKLMS